MKDISRSYVYWPRIDRFINNILIVQDITTTLLNLMDITDSKRTLGAYAMYIFIILIDFAEVFLLVISDPFSNVKILSSASTSATIGITSNPVFEGFVRQ